MKKNKLFFVLFLCCVAMPQLAFAGAWTLPQNKVWTEYSVKMNWSKYDFDSDRDIERKTRSAESWGWSTIPKMEFGFTNWFTLLGGLEYKESNYKEYNRPDEWGSYSVKSHGITSMDFGGKIRLLKDPVVVSTQIKTSFYSGKGYNESPQISDGNDAIDVRALIGKTFDAEIPFYFGAETGYRFKNRHVCNDIPVFIEGGFWPLEWLLIKSEIDAYISHDGTGNIEKEYAIWRIGPVFQLLTGEDVTRAEDAFNIGFQYGMVIWGRNTAADQEVVIKVAWQF